MTELRHWYGWAPVREVRAAVLDEVASSLASGSVVGLTYWLHQLRDCQLPDMRERAPWQALAREVIRRRPACGLWGGWVI
jgi:hypothetical protein